MVKITLNERNGVKKMEDLKISRREFLTIECSRGTYLILSEGRYVLLAGEKIRLENTLPAEITGMLSFFKNCLSDNVKTESETVKKKEKKPVLPSVEPDYREPAAAVSPKKTL